MIVRNLIALLVFSFVHSISFSQKLKKSDKIILANLQTSIQYLADDKLEGRRAGTAGETLASDYISKEFEKAGLVPKGLNDQWLQPFEINEGRQVGDASFFYVNNQELKREADYFPLPFSGIKKTEGELAIALQESGVPWFVDLKEILENNQDNPHFDLLATIHLKAKECAKKGATALVVYNSSKIEDKIEFDAKDRSEAEVIPVIYLKEAAKRKYLKDESASVDIKINVDISDKIRTGHNVIGFADNGATETVVIGAHYDHLGYGEDGNGLYRGAEKQIYNGADDNASGTAALLELARMLKQSKLKKTNFLFIAFSGEELGLFGSKYFTEHPTIDLTKVNYMINMDMIGRLNDSTHSITIGGYGTSPSWGTLFNSSKNKLFTLKFDSSGTGPSDYTSFYRKDIPVLFFFTGLHSDYHKPTDDFDKINYTGELQIVKYIFSLIEALNNDKSPKIAFTKTRETQTTTSARFSVTLGIMPDYTFSGSGVRVDGVSEGRPAQKAGIKTGDVIIQLGEYPVSSLENYMQALSKFKKGDATKVTFKRGNETSASQIQF